VSGPVGEVQADAGGEHADQVVVGGVEVFWQAEGASCLQGCEAVGGGPNAARGVDGGRLFQAVAAEDGQDHVEQAGHCRGQLRIRRGDLRERGIPVGVLDHVLAVGPHRRPQRLVAAAAHDGGGKPLGELADHAEREGGADHQRGAFGAGQASHNGCSGGAAAGP
jgi:hypothetical protein